MRRLNERQKIGKIGECWVFSGRPAHGQNTYVYEQYSHFAGLISCHDPHQKKPQEGTKRSNKTDGDERNKNSVNFYYKARTPDDEIPVCAAIFAFIFRITRERVRIQQSLVNGGCSLKGEIVNHDYPLRFFPEHRLQPIEQFLPSFEAENHSDSIVSTAVSSLVCTGGSSFINELIAGSYPAFALNGLRENFGKNLSQVTCTVRHANRYSTAIDEIRIEAWQLGLTFVMFGKSNVTLGFVLSRLRWAGHVTRMGESRNAYRVLVWRPEGKRPLGRPRRRCEDNIGMDLREVGYDDRDWINLAQAIGASLQRLREFLQPIHFSVDWSVLNEALHMTPEEKEEVEVNRR
ncbi:hypothetical protein ANN_02906 [Periplaneta americana]|uniref:Uncharacterized protein n=1 Tax=Periplaneta americana TaxID=6978 RepID=A0ABQ8U194_PERAM|nr:hypothetical protein ANN_02906 [Periplaneta americana]